MRIRSLQLEDLSEIEDIHKRFFADEFPIPNFTDKFFGSFVITDDNDGILVAGGVRPITECVIVTDKSRNHSLLGKALLEAIQVSGFISRRHGFIELHAFVQDEKFAKHLVKHEFRQTVGKSFVLDL